MIGAGVLNIIITAVINRNHSSLPLAGFLAGISFQIAREISEVSFTLGRLFLVFLKAGSFMVGSGYVLLVFIQEDLVFRLGWLTEAELLDAIAVGQVTPGPLSTTATFVGYILGGLPAALLATFAMFLPGFLFVLLSLPLLKMLKNSARGKQFLEGLNFAALGLMLGVTGQIASTALVDPITILIAVVMLIILLRTKIQTHWLILIGGLIGLIKILLG
jgi:chromate transporter